MRETGMGGGGCGGGGKSNSYAYLGGKGLIPTSIWVSIWVEKQQSQRQTQLAALRPMANNGHLWSLGMLNNNANKPTLTHKAQAEHHWAHYKTESVPSSCHPGLPLHPNPLQRWQLQCNQPYQQVCMYAANIDVSQFQPVTQTNSTDTFIPMNVYLVLNSSFVRKAITLN